MTEQLTKDNFIVPLESEPSDYGRIVHMERSLPLCCCCHELADEYGSNGYSEFNYDITENINHAFFRRRHCPIAHAAVCRRTTVLRYKTQVIQRLAALDPTTARETYDAIYAEVVGLFARFLESWLDDTSRSRRHGYSGKAYRTDAWGFGLEYRKIIKRVQFIMEPLRPL